MKDSNGNTISIGDRVKVLWNFDNKIHAGEITKINNHLVTIKSNGNPIMDSCYPLKIITSYHSRITKMHGRLGENIDK
ncbi:MAG: hypothetical protein MIO93_10175 [ANME-2 cluster archaeon]|nr:hypothetical protein [ANME-2 cluster archaeon]